MIASFASARSRAATIQNGCATSRRNADRKHRGETPVPLRNERHTGETPVPLQNEGHAGGTPVPLKDEPTIAAVKAVLDRLQLELEVIEKTGFISYFLIVADFV